MMQLVTSFMSSYTYHLTQKHSVCSLDEAEHLNAATHSSHCDILIKPALFHIQLLNLSSTLPKSHCILSKILRI